MPRQPINDMAVNTPVDAAAPDTTLIVEIDPARPLPVGSYRFQLEVVDSAGNRSSPTVARVVVADTQNPTAVINAPRTVAFGAGFTLSGAQSFDVGGSQIARYIWTRLD